jgi:hypothetical protein
LLPADFQEEEEEEEEDSVEGKEKERRRSSKTTGGWNQELGEVRLPEPKEAVAHDCPPARQQAGP